MLAYRTWSHLFNGELIDEMMVVFVQGAVQGHAVGLEQKVLQQRDDYDGQIFFMLIGLRTSLTKDRRHHAW